MLTLDGAANVYISDLFGGAIWRTNSAGQGLATWCSNALLATDGIPPFDEQDNIWVAANQAREIGEFLLVTNLALDLRKVGGPQTIHSQWADQVNRYSVSKINRHLLPLHDD